MFPGAFWLASLALESTRPVSKNKVAWFAWREGEGGRHSSGRPQWILGKKKRQELKDQCWSSCIRKTSKGWGGWAWGHASFDYEGSMLSVMLGKIQKLQALWVASKQQRCSLRRHHGRPRDSKDADVDLQQYWVEHIPLLGTRYSTVMLRTGLLACNHP